jgi:hypothetical protein
MVCFGTEMDWPISIVARVWREMELDWGLSRLIVSFRVLCPGGWNQCRYPLRSKSQGCAIQVEPFDFTLPNGGHIFPFVTLLVVGCWTREAIAFLLWSLLGEFELVMLWLICLREPLPLRELTHSRIHDMMHPRILQAAQSKKSFFYGARAHKCSHIYGLGVELHKFVKPCIVRGPFQLCMAVGKQLLPNPFKCKSGTFPFRQQSWTLALDISSYISKSWNECWPDHREEESRAPHAYLETRAARWLILLSFD